MSDNPNDAAGGQPCRYCHAPILWRKTQAGKWQPISVATGQPHFGDCQPYLDAHRPKSAGSAAPPQEAPDVREPPHRDRHTDAHGRPWYGR